MAQWIRHRPTEPGIAGSSPAGVICCDVRQLRFVHRVACHALIRNTIADRQTCRHRQADRQTDRQADIHTHTHSHTLSCSFACKSVKPSLRYAACCCRRSGLRCPLQAGYSSVGRASDCRFVQPSDGPWFDSGWPDFNLVRYCFPSSANDIHGRTGDGLMTSPRCGVLLMPCRFAAKVGLTFGEQCLGASSGAGSESMC